jgi:hypothetical protein
MDVNLLVEFLRTRLDEDEQRSDHIHNDNCEYFWNPERPELHDCGEPTRVLAEVKAKRLILDEHRPTSDEELIVCTTCADQDWVYVRRKQTGDPQFGGWPCSTIRALTLMYTDHPDYNPEWLRKTRH